MPELKPEYIYSIFCDFAAHIPYKKAVRNPIKIQSNGYDINPDTQLDVIFRSLITHRVLWFKFWHQRTGINLETIEFQGTKSQKYSSKNKLTLLLFYIDLISTVLWKYHKSDPDLMEDDSSLLKRAMNLIYEVEAKQFHNHRFESLSNSKNNIRKQNITQFSFLWNWIATLVSRYGSKKLQSIVFYNGNGYISRIIQRGFCEICVYSIGGLNKRLSTFYPS
ncbi:hypothetical protein PGTUg99_050052 [Puccinia graminis f. sp. tritici]|uniref:Uncharacterized protein n=1 Tax=Puccinia graminis f. sp. tritici TaxID=56615 RepID=A0A5B0SKA3_PUCGR|nr:hypothetical protein PGTUg99_050052 [Puccinia graminis f. sp. tritici]